MLQLGPRGGHLRFDLNDPIDGVQFGDKDGVRCGLGDEVVALGLNGRHQLIGRIGLGQENNMCPRTGTQGFNLPNTPHQSGIHVGDMVPIHQDQIRNLGPVLIKSLLTVIGDDDLVTQSFQFFRQMSGKIVHERD